MNREGLIENKSFMALYGEGEFLGDGFGAERVKGALTFEVLAGIADGVFYPFKWS